MHFMNKKKMMAILLTGVMVLTLGACGKDKKADKGNETDTTAESSTAIKQDNPEYVADDVILPEDFGNMIYPMEALMVESYSKGLPYYGDNTEEDNAESFWFSMAVLTSQMDHYVKEVAVDSDDRFLYIDEETTYMYASALYDSFGKGEIEFPDQGEDNPYASYDDDKQAFGFRQGDIGDLEPFITACEEVGADFILTTELRDGESGKALGRYTITITDTSYEGEDNAFAYAVTNFQEEMLEEESPESTTETAEEQTTEGSETDSEATAGDTEQVAISQEKALEMAKDYYGSDAEYSYKGTVTVGDYEYYNFSVKGDDISATDVLVSTSGEDVIGGVKNNDGTWSFDQ